MKITTAIMDVIVNQKQVSNQELIDILFNVAKINNISMEYVSQNIQSFFQSVVKAINNTTLEMIDIARKDKALRD